MAGDETFRLPEYLEELLTELEGPSFLRSEEVPKGRVREDGAVAETLKEAVTVKCQDLELSNERRTLFETFVSAGFAWSIRKKRRVTPGNTGKGQTPLLEPQIVWKSDADGGRPMSKRQELRRKMANVEPAKPRSQRASKQPPRRPVSRGATRRDSAIPFENVVKTATDLSLEVTGVDLLGLETTGDITPPLRHPTPTPIREGSAPTNVGSRVEFPMLVRTLAPRNLSPWFDQLGDVGDYVAPQRTFTKESSIELPEEDFFRAVSCAHRGKNGRAVSMSFLRQISPMLRQISPERRRQISEGKESNLTIQQTSPGPMVGKMMSEPVRFSGVEELRASELPSSSITFHPRTEVLDTDHYDDEGSEAGRYAALSEEDSSLSPTPRSVSQQPEFSFEDEHIQRSYFSREHSSEELPEAPPLAPSLELAPAPDPEVLPPEPEIQGIQTEASGSRKSSTVDCLEEQLGGVYLVPPWALRDHLQLNSRVQPQRENMDQDLLRVVKALEQAPALRGRHLRHPERPSSTSSSSGSSPGLVAKMRHLVATPSPPMRGPVSGPKMALGTSLLSMSHPSRGTTKAQLQAQTQAMVKCKLPRQVTHAKTEQWRLRQDTELPPAELMDAGDDASEGLPAEFSFREETFFLTEET